MRYQSRIMASLIVWATLAAQGQGMAPQAPYPNPAGPRTHADNPDDLSVKAREQQALARNNERQKKLTEDTQKLLALATELKQYVDKTDKDTMSIDVIKKADEIEKLAKSVKERMKGTG